MHLPLVNSSALGLGVSDHLEQHGDFVNVFKISALGFAKNKASHRLTAKRKSHEYDLSNLLVKI